MARRRNRRRSRNENGVSSASLPQGVIRPDPLTLRDPVLSAIPLTHTPRSLPGTGAWDNRRADDPLFDRRQFHPSGPYRPAGTLRGNSPPRALIVPRGGRLPSQIAFQAPREVLVCVRRKVRKAVLHALGRAGRRGPQRTRRLTWFSGVSC